MILLSWLTACSTSEPPPSRPVDLPETAAVLRFSGNDLLLDDVAVLPTRALQSGEPEDLEPLQTQLAERAPDGVWVALPGNARWSEVRQLVHAVKTAKTGPFWLGAHGADHVVGPLGLPDSKTRAVLGCEDGGVQVTGYGARLSFEVQTDMQSRWATATLRFLPEIQQGDTRVLAELLPLECWRGASCDQLSGVAAEACRSASGEPVDRLPLGGPEGCLAPPAKDELRWKDTVTTGLKALGLEHPPTLVMSDDHIAYADALVLFESLDAAGITPRVGLLPMGSGEPRPTCDSPIRTPDDIAKAAGAWYGAALAHTGAPE